MDHIARRIDGAARLRRNVEKGVTLTRVVLDQKEGATHLRQSKEDDWSLPKEHLPRRAAKHIAAYQEVTAIDQHICRRPPHTSGVPLIVQHSGHLYLHAYSCPNNT